MGGISFLPYLKAHVKTSALLRICAQQNWPPPVMGGEREIAGALRWKWNDAAAGRRECMKLGAVYVQVQLQDLDGSERDRCWPVISFLPPPPCRPAADGFRNQDSFRSGKATVPGRDKILC